MWDYLLPFCLLHNHHSIPPIVLYPWLTLMYCVKIKKVLRMSKVWNNCLACHRGCAWFKYFVWWRGSIARLYDFVGITFFSHVILRRHDCFDLYAWSIITFMSIWTFVLNLSDLNIHATIKKIYIEIMLKYHSASKIFFIIYLLEDEQELSLGMLDTSPTYL